MKVVGITGVIGSGKTTVSHYLKNAGYYVFDADSVVNRIYNESSFLERLIKIFPDAFTEEGNFDKGLLTKVVFDNKILLKELENLIHPLVEHDCDLFIERSRLENRKIIFIDVPLLFETGWDKKCNYTIVVSISPLEQKRRYLLCGGKEEDLLKRINCQMSDDERVKRASFVIDNNNDKLVTFSYLDKTLKEINDLVE